MKTIWITIVGCLAVFCVGQASADYALNLTRGVTSISREVYDMHMYVFWICVAIGVVVFSVMFYSIFHHRKSAGAIAEHFHENTTVEVVWTVIPFLILISMAIPATKAMIDMYDTSNADMTIKVTGYQWKWRYEYMDDGIDFFSSLDAKSNAARQMSSGIDPASVPNYLLNVDKPLVIPANKKVRFVFTAADVIHSWWVPDFGWKKDAIPGYVTDAWARIDEPGVYRGQCTELCGRDHGFMPIVVNVMPETEYRQWVTDWKQQHTKAEEPVGKVYSQAELIERGKEVYEANCAGCHQANGEGIPGNFPAIKGSAVATGPLKDHVSIVLKGKNAMPAFADMLEPIEAAAVITYQRNALGNAVGDSIQPSEIKGSN